MGDKRQIEKGDGGREKSVLFGVVISLVQLFLGEDMRSFTTRGGEKRLMDLRREQGRCATEYIYPIT